MRYRLFVSTFCLGFLVAAPLLVASAHQPSDYPGVGGWKYTYLNRVFYQSPTTWPNSYNARTNDAMAHWNNVSGSALTFDLAGNAASNGWNCDTDHDLLKSGDLDGLAYAETGTCEASQTPVRITVNSVNGFYFFTGADPDNMPSGYVDLEGVLTHEFGHALRGWGQCQHPDDPDEDVDPCHGSHYDSQINGLICDQSDWQAYATMCWGIPKNETWRNRSLEAHDRDLVAAKY
jgi:hypothetical protein